MDVPHAVSRREFVGAGLAGLASAAFASPLRSIVDGVHVGLQTFSLRGIHYPELVAAVAQTGIGECELFSIQLQAAPTGPDGRGPQAGAARGGNFLQWQDSLSPEFLHQVRRRFNQAGITIYTYNPIWRPIGAFGRGLRRGGSGRRGVATMGRRAARAMPPGPPLTDAQIESIFQSARALGARTLSGQMTVETARRVAPFARRYEMPTGLESTDPEALKQVAALSPWMRMSVDIGNFTHLGLNGLQFVKDNYAALLEVHLKDSKFLGASVPFGEGDAHMKQVLQFLAGKNGSVRAYIDCDYPGTGTSVAEVRECFAYVQSCLA